MWKIIRRANCVQVPEMPLPIYIRSTGNNNASPGWSECEHSHKKDFVQLFWTVSGTGEIELSDRVVRVSAGDVMYRLPYEEHIHRNVSNTLPWHYYWFTFDGAAARDFMLSYGYPQESRFAGECPTHLFDQLGILLQRSTPSAYRHAISVATEILALAGDTGNRRQATLVEAFIQEIQKNYVHPEYTVEALAESLNVHRSTIFRVVTEELGISPRRYLMQIRLQKGMSLLLDSTRSVKEIAGMAGFGKVDYFCRQVQDATGYTPTVYRTMFSERNG